MSESFYNAQNLTVANGFVKNPNRYYLEDFFDKLPTIQHTFILTGSGNTDFNIIQPANTFLKEAYVVCVTAPTINTGNAGVSISHTQVEDMTAGTVVVGSATNIINNHTTMAASSIAKVFPDTEMTPSSGGVETSVGYSSSRRTLYCRVRTSSALNGNAGSFRLVVNFGSVETGGNYLFNPYFIISGTNASSVNINYATNRSGAALTTAGAALDQVIVEPKYNAWNDVKWGTENQVEWECALSIADISNVVVWSGLKLTNTATIATDDNQAYFLFSSADTLSNTLTTNTALHFVYSKDGSDYVTNLGITVTADDIYRLRISIDSARRVSVFVNGIQYGLLQTTDSAGTTVSTKTQKSVALKDDIDLIPFVGVHSTTAEADTLTLYYQKISRVLFE